MTKIIPLGNQINAFLSIFLSAFLFLNLQFPQIGQCNPGNRRTPVVAAVETVSPAVVNISTEYEIQRHVNPFGGLGLHPHFDYFFRDFFDPGYRRKIKRHSLGSGVIIDGERGFILTNAHVIAESSTITIILKDEREFQAQVVGVDPDSDLSVLRIPSDSKLPSIDMGDSDDIMIGETVIAIGNPFGFSHTVTTGVVSAINRSFKTEDREFHNFIQTDASINPGNSGGPLLNINGELIGINTAIYASAQGIGFAIPINKARRIINDLILYGEVVQAWTGLIVQNIDPRLATYLKLPSKTGVVVTDVEKNSPAEKADIQDGDVLLKINRQKIQSASDFNATMKSIAAGEAVDVELLKQGKTFSVRMKTSAYPMENALSLAYSLLGVEVVDIQDTRYSGSSLEGAVITKIKRNSYLAQIGVQAGDIIRQVDEVPIKTVEDFKKAIVKYRLKSSLVVLIQRGGRAYYIHVEL